MAIVTALSLPPARLDAVVTEVVVTQDEGDKEKRAGIAPGVLARRNGAGADTPRLRLAHSQMPLRP
jgi:hypothetical protein